MERSKSNGSIFWPLAAAVVLLDIITKWLAVRSLMPRGLPREVFGEWARLTLVYNRGAAFGLDLGPYSRWIFLFLTLVALVILGRLYRATMPGDKRRVLALSLVCGGAVGNLVDRVRSPLGVVDFLDIGVGAVRWPTFNVADIAVTIGAVLLAWSLWSEDRVAARSETAPKGALS